MPTRGSWAGKLALIVGWLLSCALVTGVTLTAVSRVGHEISGTQPQVTTEQQVNKQLTQQAEPSLSPIESALSPSPAVSPSRATTPSAKADPKPTVPAATPTTTPSRHPKPLLTPSPSHATSAPTTTSAPATKPAVSLSPQPPISSAPVTSPPPSSILASPSVSPSPTATVLTGKKTIKVPGNNAPTGGEIIIACSGDTIGQYAIVLTTGSKFSYTTPNPPPDPTVKIDVTFVDPSTTTTYHYVVSCADGQVVGSQPLTERAG